MRTLSVRAFAVGLLIAAACAHSASRDDPRADAPAPTPVAEGSWSQIRRAPVGWYHPEGAFWADGRVVVVAASTVQAWDPQSGQWSTIATIPQADECEGCGYSQTVVWTGEELLMWGGGFGYLAPDGSEHDGASVDLEGNIEPLPSAPIRVRWWHDSVWTGREMIVFGGGHDSYARRDGAAFDPSTRTWRRIARSPIGGYANSLVWTGTEMITWGGIKDSASGVRRGFPTGFVATGAAYDPVSNKWRVLEDAGLDPRGWHSAVWTGEDMIVWGGVEESQSTCYDCGYPSDAGAYDPATGVWREIDPGPLTGRVEHSAVWTGENMIVYGGSAPGGGAGKDDGGVYALDEDSWATLPDAPIVGRYRHAALWFDGGMFVWGGQRARGGGYRGGAVFRPGGS